MIRTELNIINTVRRNSIVDIMSKMSLSCVADVSTEDGMLTS